MFRLLLIALLGASLAPPAVAAKKPAQKPPVATDAERAEANAGAPQSTEMGDRSSPKVTGIYSTLKSLGGDDDMIGIEVIIVRSRDGFRAFVQTADGVPGTPMLVPVTFDGQTLSFMIPSTTGEPLQFKGKVTRQGLSGTLDDRPLTLPRRRSYWQ